MKMNISKEWFERMAHLEDGHEIGAGVGFVPTHRHRKGGLYRVLMRDARLEATNTPAVIYQAQDGTVWVRGQEEFDDGRFEPLSPTPPVAGSGAEG